MNRPRKYWNNAEKQKAYRERKKRSKKWEKENKSVTKDLGYRNVAKTTGII